MRISAYQLVFGVAYQCVSDHGREVLCIRSYQIRIMCKGEGGVEGVRIRCVSGAYQKVWLEGVYHVCIELVSHLYRTLRISGRIKRFVIQCDTVTESVSRCITLYHSCDTE